MFYERLREVCREKGTNVTTMLSDLGLSTGNTGAWKKGTLPKGEALVKIAEYLGTSVDYILFGEYRDDLTAEEKHLLELYRSAPDRAKYKVVCDFERRVEQEIEKLAREKGIV